jgi:Periplasmic binding protein
VVRIGLIVDMSSPYSYLAGEDTITAARMAVEDFGGQVLGHPIDIVYADHRSKSDIAAAQAREWFDAGKVDALVDVTGSSAELRPCLRQCLGAGQGHAGCGRSEPGEQVVPRPASALPEQLASPILPSDVITEIL